MDKLVIASTRKSAGKTSFIVGLAKALENKKIAYIKPFGDRLLYRKKRLWDYDAALMTNIFELSGNAEDITIGFEHSKLKFMYDEAGIENKLKEVIKNTSQDKDLVIAEGGKDLIFGVSVRLDPMNVTKLIGGKLILVLSGTDDAIVDDIAFFKKYIAEENIPFAGIVVNKVSDVADFKNTYLPEIEQLGAKVLGIIPYEPELSYLSISYLADTFFAKVIAGESALNNIVKNIFVGSMSVNQTLKDLFHTKDKKLIITSGDRSDIILEAIHCDTSGIILTNNILPHANIISQAEARNVPLLLVSEDTYQIAKKVDEIEPLLSKDNTEKIDLLKQLVVDNVNLKELLK